MNWRPALPALPLRHQGPWCRPSPGPLEEQGVSCRPLSRGLSWGTAAPPAGGPRRPAHKPPGSSAATLCAPGRREDKRELAAPGGGHLHWCLETELPLKGGGQGGLQRRAGPLRAPAPAPAASWARDEACGWQTQTRHLEGHVRRQGPRDGPGLRGDLRWDGVASEVSVRARRGLEGWGGQQLHPQAPREGLKAADGGLEQQVGYTLATSTPRLPAHLSPGQAHRQLTCQLKPRVDNSLPPHTSPTWRRLHALPLRTRRSVHTRLLEVFGEKLRQRQGAAAPPRGALGLLDQRLSRDPTDGTRTQGGLRQQVPDLVGRITVSNGSGSAGAPSGAAETPGRRGTDWAPCGRPPALRAQAGPKPALRGRVLRAPLPGPCRCSPHSGRRCSGTQAS